MSGAFNVGGICGYAAEGQIESCYNLGTVSNFSNSNGGGNTAGIVGMTINANMINCYNAGVINGRYGNIGGIVGSMGDGGVSSVNYAINVGNVFKDGSLAVSSNGVSNGKVGFICGNWNLNDGTDSMSNSISTSNEQLKNYTNDELQSKLGSEFIRDENNINNGFPILKWQVGQ